MRKGQAKVNQIDLLEDDTTRVAFKKTDDGVEIAIYTWQYDILLAKMNLDDDQVHMLNTFLNNLFGDDAG